MDENQSCFCCLLCLNDNRKSSHCLNACIHSWSRHLNLLNTLWQRSLSGLTVVHIKTAAGRNVQCNFENRQQFSCSSLRYALSVGTCSRVIWHGSKMKAAFTRALQTFIFSNEIRLFDSFALDINWTLGVKRPVIGKSLLPQLGFFYNLKEVQESSFPLRPPVIMDNFPKDLKIGYLRRLLCCCGLICRQVNLCTSSHPLTYASSFLPFHSDWPKQDRRGHSPFAKRKHGNKI